MKGGGGSSGVRRVFQASCQASDVVSLRRNFVFLRCTTERAQLRYVTEEVTKSGSQNGKQDTTDEGPSATKTLLF